MEINIQHGGSMVILMTIELFHLLNLMLTSVLKM